MNCAAICFEEYHSDIVWFSNGTGGFPFGKSGYSSDRVEFAFGTSSFAIGRGGFDFEIGGNVLGGGWNTLETIDNPHDEFTKLCIKK